MLNDAFHPFDVTANGVTIHGAHLGSGPPLLLLHGYPQTHRMWHLVAPWLARHFHLICPDLRGYGDSAKPPSEATHANYAKRVMAQDMVEVMRQLGYTDFLAAGHDRGARVAHRMALDHPETVRGLCVMDILPTLYQFEHTDQTFATGYYHWFFLQQPEGLPERLIGNDPTYYLMEKLHRWGGPEAHFDPQAVAEYIRCFSDPETIRATCEDYRAAAGIDLEHDRHDAGRKLTCPTLVLWGEQGFVGRHYDVPAVWRDYAENIEGRSLPCGHFLPEEKPEEVYQSLYTFFSEPDELVPE